jgi:hypothetical protein
MEIIADIFFCTLFIICLISVIYFFLSVITAAISEMFGIYKYTANLNNVGNAINFFNAYSGICHSIPQEKWLVGWKRYRFWTIGIYKRKYMILEDIMAKEAYSTNILESIILKKVIPIKDIEKYYFLIRY